jgi:SAM-dependent methyltransferase
MAWKKSMLEGYVRRCLLGQTVPNLSTFLAYFRGRRALEIGGPSWIFSDGGCLPVYRALKSVDNCLFSSETMWTGRVQGGRSFKYHPRKEAGLQFICEGTALTTVRDSSYQCVLASHSLEHIANPLKALEEWKRVLEPDGLMLLVLPHRDGAFDWRRPITDLAHLAEDYEKNIGEDDRTHFSEILALHDADKCAPETPEHFRQRCLGNFKNRGMHHHVFDTNTALEMTNRSAFQVLRVDALEPYHIIILAQRWREAPNNARFLGTNAEYRRQSPFASDRFA